MANEIMSKEDEKIWGLIGYALGIVGFIIVYLVKKENNYAMFYGKQGLVLTIVSVVGSIISMIPFFGWIISLAVSIGVLVLWIIGIIYSLSGEKKNVPLIGELANKINL
jgi:uncharacterized membrane protein